MIQTPLETYQSPSPTPVANSTATGLPQVDTNINFGGQMYATPMAPNQTSAFGAQYSPQAGPATQKVADANYASAITGAVSSSAPVPSSAITSGSSLAGAGATRNSYESLLQQYLDQQKADRAELKAAQTPSAELMSARTGYADLTAEAKLAQERALNSGETTAFAGGEAQRIGRTYDIKLAASAAKLQMLETGRTEKVKALQDLVNSGQTDFKTQLEIQKLQNDVSGIDKQATDTFFNVAQKYNDVQYAYDPTKTPVENFRALNAAVVKSPSYQAEQRRAEKLASAGSGTGSSGPKTLEERKALVVDKYSQILTPGHYINGIPLIDDKGKVTPEGWKAAITSAPGQGLSRKDFIEQYGYLLWVDRNGNADPKYGLTPKEQALISG